MHSHQITINPPSLPSAPFRFSLKFAGRTIQRTPIQKPTIHVHCDLCGEQNSGKAAELRRAGWGLFPNAAFCPIHQEMI